MAKSHKKILAQLMRKKGKSIKEIARFLEVSRSSVSVWCRDVKLTFKQIKNLHERMVTGGYIGRLKGAYLQRSKKELKIKEYEQLGIKNIGNLNNRELLLIGIGLYLGEGNKQGNKFQFTNSNPDIVRLIILWLEKCFKVKRNNLDLTIFINLVHINREQKLLDYWTKITKTNIDQFHKTIFIKSKNKKLYLNHDNYFGILSVRVKKSSNLQYKILGLCYGILKKI